MKKNIEGVFSILGLASLNKVIRLSNVKFNWFAIYEVLTLFIQSIYKEETVFFHLTSKLADILKIYGYAVLCH
jgi:hypothetical protein